MIRATKIRLERAEGPTHQCGKPQEFSGDNPWAEVIPTLLRWAMSAPGAPGRINLGGDKTDFTVTWADGETYSGTLYLRYDEYSIPAHMRGFIKHVIDNREVYEREGTNVDDFVTFLDTYEIGRQS